MDRNSGLILLEPATSLGDVYKTMSTEPLLTPPELQAFYRVLPHQEMLPKLAPLGGRHNAITCP